MTRDTNMASTEDFQAFLARHGVVPVAGKKAPRRDLGSEPGNLEEAWRGGRASASDLALLASDYFDLPRADYEALIAMQPRYEDLSLQFLRENFMLPYLDADTPWLALADPSETDAIKAVSLAIGTVPRLCVVSFEECELLLERIGRESGASQESIEDPALDIAFETDNLQALQDLARGAPIVRAIDQILERALESGATDIHFETERESLRIRFRVDGILRLDQTLPRHLAPAVISRVKILSGLDIAERRLPQDGRANVMIRNSEADLRVAIMPTLYGETAVARILLKDAKLLDFRRMGMSTGNRDAIEYLLKEPHGILIVTGPTGSGKTTTLAAAISLLNDPGRKIVTIEDPIEYQIPGIHQTQIKPSIGLTFASALRSFLRHDPDVIMVGEMRDGETASIGIQAALTGHLVLTTLHTNSAVDAVVRLSDMGVEPFLISASLRGVIGQRLVRRLCERCKEPDPASGALVSALCQKYALTQPADRNFLKAGGCPACGQTGFRGRVGLFEVLQVNADVRSLISAKADPDRILACGRKNGLTTMIEDGLTKAGLGLTTIDEVLRTVG